MPSMLELVQQCAVPAAVMRSAAHGALSLPASERLEILVHLAGTKMWGEQAQLTLAAWKDDELMPLLQQPSKAVMGYFLRARNIRPAVLGLLVESASVSEEQLAELAGEATTSTIKLLLACPRVQRSPQLLHVLAENPCIGMGAAEQVAALLKESSEDQVASSDAAQAHDPATAEFIAKNAAEIAAAEGVEFALSEATPEEHHELVQRPQSVTGTRLTVLQKIAKMTVSERVQLAMRGSRDERFILIRDVVRIVAVAVLESPKVTETEMEGFASMRNVSEDVLRAIARNRRFMKHYAVIRALVNNPRTPADLGISLLPHLLALDLRHLSRNRNVGEQIQKMALKLFRQKNERGPQ